MVKTERVRLPFCFIGIVGLLRLLACVVERRDELRRVGRERREHEGDVEGGDADALEKLVGAVKKARDALVPRKNDIAVGGKPAVAAFRPALLLKVGPDMDEAGRKHMAHLALHCGVDGLVVSNTTNDRFDGKLAVGGMPAGTVAIGGGEGPGEKWVQPVLKSAEACEPGGLSGAPLKGKALASLREMYRLTEGRIPIVGVGGISSGADAYERIRAGASLVQVYTALAYEGPGLAQRINGDLAMLLERDGFMRVADAVGVDASTRVSASGDEATSR